MIMSFQKMTMDSLKETIPLIQQALPKSTMICNMINMKLCGVYPEEDTIEFYSYNNDTPESMDGLFLIGSIELKYHTESYTVVYSPDVLTNDMLNAFSQFCDWTKPIDFESIMLPFSTCLEKMAKEKDGSLSKNLTHEYYLPINDALSLNLIQDVNEEYELDKLSYEHGKKVNDFWRYGFNGGDVYLGRAIQSMGGTGVFKKRGSGLSCRSNDDLVSWIVRHYMGTLSALYTLEAYRRLGLAKRVLEGASQWIAKEGFLPMCQVERYNKESRNLVEKVGYKWSHDAYWMHYTPPPKPQDGKE